MNRFYVRMPADVHDALIEMGRQDLRYPKQQLVHLVRQEAVRRGILKSEDTGADFGERQPVSSVRTA